MTDQRNNHLIGNGLSREAVKFIAILTMTGNHAAAALLPPGPSVQSFSKYRIFYRHCHVFFPGGGVSVYQL